LMTCLLMICCFKNAQANIVLCSFFAKNSI
jgi:hypothetical protein